MHEPDTAATSPWPTLETSALPYLQLWSGQPELCPSRAEPLLRWICCGDCDVDYIECIDPLLQVLLTSAAQHHCEHLPTSGLLCPECSLQVLAVAERSRNSGYWLPTDHETAVRNAAAALHKHQLAEQTDLTLACTNYARMLDDDEVVDPIDYLRDALPAIVQRPTLQQVQTIIDDLSGQAVPNWPRTATHAPRAGYQPAEEAIAERLGLDETPRYTVERLVRAAAVQALTEADFVRLAHEAGVRMHPRVATAAAGILAYSAVLNSLPPENQREYGGRQLARDLVLSHLRTTWGPDPSGPMDAWATWSRYTSIRFTQVVPGPRTDGRWRWLHPDADLDTPPVVAPTEPPATPNARRRTARQILMAGQGGVCAMCSIRYHHWRTASPSDAVRPGNPLVMPAEHLDHDHGSGLIRGLLCAVCNTYREPTGRKANEDVWRSYTVATPAADLGCRWSWH